MKATWITLVGLWLVLMNGGLAFAEDWKGESDISEGSFGVINGLGIINSSTGYTLIGTVSKKIITNGFIPDLSNSVSIEGLFGPVFLSGVTGWLYSAHLRWDFEKDVNWAFFAVGGLGGNVVSQNNHTDFILSPRFGVGAFWKVTPQIKIRGDIAHDLVTVGINVPF